MLQRFDISIDDKANNLTIEEFAVLGRVSRKSEHFEPANEKYLLIHEVTYDTDRIRVAINKGTMALISELRSDDFFPISPCMEKIAEGVIELFGDDTDSFYEVFFDDRTLINLDDEH